MSRFLSDTFQVAVALVVAAALAPLVAAGVEAAVLPVVEQLSAMSPRLTTPTTKGIQVFNAPDPL
jgi:hypothetical protein